MEGPETSRSNGVRPVKRRRDTKDDACRLLCEELGGEFADLLPQIYILIADEFMRCAVRSRAYR